MRVAGIMSGTSLDGIDVAIVDIQGVRRTSTLALRTTPYPARVREALLGVLDAAAISRLNFRLGELYAQALQATCERSRVPIESVELIGCHGQTIYHEVGNTLQIGEAAVIAERIAARARPEQVIAFDTGPGNMVVDALVAEYTGGKQRFDRDGRIARQGSVNQGLLHELLRDRYYHSAPPKSAGREQYGAAFVKRLLETGLPLPELIATATALTAAAVAEGIERFVRPRMKVDELIVSGGGAHNAAMMGFLAALLPDLALAISSDFGVDVDGKEAIAFAVLAYETWRRRPANLPSATGARRAVVLGKISR